LHLAQDGFKDRGEPVCPGVLFSGGSDQVVAQFDQHVGATVLQCVPVHAIAGQVAGVWLVVADCQVALRPQRRYQGMRQAGIGGIKNAYFPRAWRAAAQLRRKAVDRHQDRAGARGETRLSVVVGAITQIQTRLALCGVRVAVGGDDRAVIELHQECRIVFATVRVDHEARKIAEKRRSVEPFCQGSCQPCGTDVIGDVTLHIFGREAKRAAVDLNWNRVGGMVARHQPAAWTVLAFYAVRIIIHLPVTFAGQE